MRRYRIPLDPDGNVFDAWRIDAPEKKPPLVVTAIDSRDVEPLIAAAQKVANETNAMQRVFALRDLRAALQPFEEGTDG
jgi:hypothetical protein